MVSSPLICVLGRGFIGGIIRSFNEDQGVAKFVCITGSIRYLGGSCTCTFGILDFENSVRFPI
jgi:hypothetical protein